MQPCVAMRAALVLSFSVAATGCMENVETPPATSCPMMDCPTGNGRYGFCVDASFSACRYVTSDGSEFDCASCGDCGDASRQALAWWGAPVGVASAKAPDGGKPDATPAPALDGGSTPAAAPDGGGAAPDGGDACTACAHTAATSTCAQADAACANDPACTQLASCLDACAPNDTACLNACWNAAPQSAADELSALDQCICTACAQPCVGRC